MHFVNDNLIIIKMLQNRLNFLNFLIIFFWFMSMYMNQISMHFTLKCLILNCYSCLLYCQLFHPEHQILSTMSAWLSEHLADILCPKRGCGFHFMTLRRSQKSLIEFHVSLNINPITTAALSVKDHLYVKHKPCTEWMWSTMSCRSLEWRFQQELPVPGGPGWGYGTPTGARPQSKDTGIEERSFRSASPADGWYD